jgi:hypothetical protein
VKMAIFAGSLNHFADTRAARQRWRILNESLTSHRTKLESTALMDDKISLQAWQAGVRAVLRQLRRGPLLEDAQLRSLHITFRPPSPIPKSQLVRDHLPAFLESKKGRNFTWNLEHMRTDIVEYPEDWPVRISNLSTSSHIQQCTDGLGDQIWGERERDYKTEE